MCVDESFLWLYVYCEIWYDEKHVPCMSMGRGEYLLICWLATCFHLHPGGAENENLNLVERLGTIGDARRMDVMVGAQKKLFTLSHINFLVGL